MLLVEDDEAIRFGISSALVRTGYQVQEARGCTEARDAFTRSRPDIVLLDYRLPDGDALALLSELRVADPSVPIVIVTGHGSIDLAVRSLKQGAEDFLVKPVDKEVLIALVDKTLAKRRRRRAVSARMEKPPLFVGKSAPMRQLYDDVERLRDADCPVLILGETGTGKSIIARRIHEIGRRHMSPFVELNCATLTGEFVEAQLFGHEKGAFTGAHTARAGLLEAADKGSLFLDEVGDIAPSVQPKVLKVLEEKRFRRMGDPVERQVDVRLIAATHRDLRHAANGDFRQDLYYRISTVTLTVPSLRERAEDILPLSIHLLHELATREAEPVPTLTSSAGDALLAHRWPGNVRELKNVLERAMLLRRDAREIGREDLRFDHDSAQRPTDPEPENPAPRAASNKTLQEMEIDLIRDALVSAGGRVEVAAKRLGIPRSTFYQKLKTYGISASKIRMRDPGPGS